jgi:hypothetical protein
MNKSIAGSVIYEQLQVLVYNKSFRTLLHHMYEILIKMKP